MNQQVKTILLTVLTLSVFTIAIVELTGISNNALFNKYNIGEGDSHVHEDPAKVEQRKAQIKEMPKTQISFIDTKHDFGTITEGEKVSHAYHFTNTGDNPLLISNAVASCGCTVPSYPKEPIPPGGEGEIVVEFNTTNRVGQQKKNVIIYSNAKAEKTSIGFTAEVVEK